MPGSPDAQVRHEVLEILRGSRPDLQIPGDDREKYYRDTESNARSQTVGLLFIDEISWLARWGGAGATNGDRLVVTCAVASWSKDRRSIIPCIRRHRPRSPNKARASLPGERPSHLTVVKSKPLGAANIRPRSKRDWRRLRQGEQYARTLHGGGRLYRRDTGPEAVGSRA